MVIFFVIDSALAIAGILGVVGFAGLAVGIMHIISAIWWAICVFAVPICVVGICINKVKRYFNNDANANCLYIPIYLIAGFTSVLFFESSIAIKIEYVDKAQWWGPICAILFIQLLVMIEKLFTHLKKTNLGAILDFIVLILVMVVVMSVAYNSYKQDIKESASDKCEVFIVNYDCHPAIEVTRKYRSVEGSESICFPFGINRIFETKYPLAKFKEGTSVIGIDGEFHERDINGVECILVYDSENDIAGYVPEEALTIVKKRMYVVDTASPIYLVGRGERTLVSPGGQQATIECDVVSSTVIGELLPNTPVEIVGIIGYTGETIGEYKFSLVKLSDGTEGCVLTESLQPMLVSVN